MSDVKHTVPTITVGELVRRLQQMPHDLPVECWLPGSYIALGSVFPQIDRVLIEGNVQPGSALDI